RRGRAVESFTLLERGEPIAAGVAIGQAVATGRVKVLHDPREMDRFVRGDVLVTERTDPDRGPIMKLAAAIGTDHGGRTSHAAIVSRELGIPAVVGTGTGTRRLADDREVTISCAEGDEGRVYAGKLRFERRELDLAEL